LKLLGSPSIQRPEGELVGGQPAQRHRIALLALLARSPERGVGREKVMGYLWPESSPDHARNLLNVSVYVLRKALGEDALLSAGDQLRLNQQVIQSDVAAFEAAVSAGEYERAVAFYDGPFLDGFFLNNVPEFERWVDRERDRLAGSCAKALEALADASEAGGDPATAAAWWKARAAQDPYDSRVAGRLIRALEAAGNPAAALQHAAIHERLLQDEFDVWPDRATIELVESIRQRRESQQTAPAPAMAEAPSPAVSPAGAGDDERDDQQPVHGAAPSAASKPPEQPSHRTAYGGLLGRVAAMTVAVLALWGLAALLSPDNPRPGAAIDGLANGAPTSNDERGASVDRREPVPRSIAVLPFVNRSADPEEEYLSDGLAEELIGALARIGSLRVAARTSSFAFKGKTGDVTEIGEALNVATVLEGSVRREGDRLMVLAQLIDANDGLLLWSETWEGRITEVFEIQRDLALRIAAALEAELTPGERERLASRPTEHLEAFTWYLRGRYFFNQRTPLGYERAIEYFQRATAVDPRYAAAWAGLAGVYSLQGLAGTVDADSARHMSRVAARRATELDAGIAEAHTALGLYLHAYEWNAPAAEREFLQAITLNPTDAPARQAWGNLLAAMGRIDEAIAQKEIAAELDPLMPALSETLAFTLVRAGRLEEAMRQVANALELDSTYWRAHAVLGLVHEQSGHADDAIRAYERANTLAGANTHRTRADIARVLARAGRVDEARRLVATLRNDAQRTGSNDPAVATALLALGEVDAAFDWLERGLRQRQPHLAFVRGDARFADLDREPRFADLLRRVGI
jgi:serine/threonine-protein kinase